MKEFNHSGSSYSLVSVSGNATSQYSIQLFKEDKKINWESSRVKYLKVDEFVQKDSVTYSIKLIHENHIESLLIDLKKDTLVIKN